MSAGKSAAQAHALLASFESAFHSRWKRLTSCAPGYVMEDCSEYSGKPEDLTAASSSGSGSGSSSSSGAGASSSGRSSPSGASRSASTGTSRSTAGSSSSSSGGELPAPVAGAMTLSSPAFERNGEIPKQYTCDGANVSPPLEWQNVPAKAAALVLFAIDETATGPAGGIRWVVGDIDPSSKGVAAGQTPAGGIVGATTQGKAGYGGICPANSKTSTVEFVLYALSKRIPLTPGFQPDVAEQQYGAGKLLLGEGAVTYGLYTRG